MFASFFFTNEGCLLLGRHYLQETCSSMDVQSSIYLPSLIPSGCHFVALIELAIGQEKDRPY
jgi:hypothetical protein